MSSNFSKIPPLTTELSALGRQKKNQYITCGHSSAFMFERIFFILVGKEDNHNVSDEFEIRPDKIMYEGIQYVMKSFS